MNKNHLIKHFYNNVGGEFLMMKNLLYKEVSKPILILGETGTGKSCLAKELHYKSSYKDLPFISCNIAALSHNLFESELFGHIRGAFTGADRTKLGYLDRTGLGTLFVDEIGELSLTQQVKLLHLLDDGGYFPVGSMERKVFRGRLIFATNKNLKKMVSQGEFREDLYFRIRYFQVFLPPLKSLTLLEKEEIIKKEIENKKIEKNNFKIVFASNIIKILKNYSWPGNFRELTNTIDYFFALNKPSITDQDLPAWIESNHTVFKVVSAYREALEDFEKAFLEEAMLRYNGQINYTSEIIGLSKVTLISKLKKYGINRKNYHLQERAIGF